MKLLRLILMVAVLCLTTSCGTIGNWRIKHAAQTEVAFCPQNAYLNLKDYEIEGPKDNKDFRERYSPEIAKKYPPLKDAYELLYECWQHYHPTK